MDRLEEAQIANARLNTMREFWDHPQLQARDRWRSGFATGTIKALVPPVTMQGVEPRMDPIPAVGQHTHAILRELDFDDAFITKLENEKAISRDNTARSDCCGAG